MKDIPMFTTDQGVASLILREVPYRQEAYIRVGDVQPGGLEELLAECGGFCRAVGAERIFWTWKEAAGTPYAMVYEMRGTPRITPSMVEHLFPVTEATVSRWRQLYNERMARVDNASTLTAKDEKEILGSGGAYFIHHASELLGIGWMKDDRLLAIASLKPGAGQRVAHTLLSVAEGQAVSLEVASTNIRAIRLYEELGFVKVREVVRWFLL